MGTPPGRRSGRGRSCRCCPRSSRCRSRPSTPSDRACRPTARRRRGRPDSRATAFSIFGFSELSGKIAATFCTPDLVHQAVDRLRRRLRLRGQRRDHGADRLEAVAVGVVAERVVRGHELALRAGEAVDAGGHVAVEAAQPLGVRAGAGALGRRPRAGRRRSPRRRAPRCAGPATSAGRRRAGAPTRSGRPRACRRRPTRSGRPSTRPPRRPSGTPRRRPRWRGRRWGAARSRAGRSWAGGSA